MVCGGVVRAEGGRVARFCVLVWSRMKTRGVRAVSEVDSVHAVLVGLELEGDRHRGREQRVRTRF